MFSFHEAPPPSRPWSAIIREPCASAPVSASSRQSRIASSGSARMARAQRRERAQVARREQLAEVAQAGADELARLPAGEHRRPRRVAVARRLRQRGQPHVGPQRLLAAGAAAPRAATWTATISAPRRAVAASAASPRSAGTASRATRPPRRAPPPAPARRPPRSASGSHGAAVVRARKIANGLTSMPTAGRPSAAASIGATPEPQNGSSTRSPGAVAAAMRAATRSGGLRDQYLWSR